MGDVSVIAHTPRINWDEARQVLSEPVTLDDGRQIVPLDELERISAQHPEYAGYLTAMRVDGVQQGMLRPLMVSLQHFLIAEQQEHTSTSHVSGLMRGVHAAMSPRQMVCTQVVQLLRDATDRAWREAHGSAPIANIHPMDILVGSPNVATRALREHELPDLVARLEETLGAEAAIMNETDAFHSLVGRINRLAELLQRENTHENVDAEQLEDAHAALHSAIRLVEDWRAERAG